MKLSATGNLSINRPFAAVNAGLTLIEILVAIALGAILLAGAIQLFVNNRATYELTTDMARLQENARFALQAMVRDIRMAGHNGCGNDFRTVADNTGFAVGTLANPDNSLEGIDNGNGPPANWSPSGYGGGASSPTSGFLANADAITVRYLIGGRADTDGDNILDLQVRNSVTAGASQGIQVNNNTTNLGIGAVAGISDCGGADLFTVTNVNVAANTITANSLSRAYSPVNRAQVGRFFAVRYFLRNNAENVPSLFRVGFDPTPGSLASEEPLASQEELVDGVQSMQILYGIDTNDDLVPDQFLAAGAVGLQIRDDWLSVVAVQISLLMRTAGGMGQFVDNNIYQVGDVRFCRAGITPAPSTACNVTWPTDNFRRRVFQTTISIRNS